MAIPLIYSNPLHKTYANIYIDSLFASCFIGFPIIKIIGFY